jgi:hypothetical protein
MFDAWAAYDEKAVGSRLGSALRRPEAERTLWNKQVAISYASLHSLRFVYPESRAWLDERMRAFGFDPDAESDDLATPIGIGFRAARTLP